MERATRNARQASVTGEDGEVVGDFLDLAGHELRAPLAALKGHAQMLQRRLAKQPERADDLADLHKVLYQVERLEHGLDIYLEASRLMGDRFELAPEPAELVVITQRLVEVYSASAAGETIRVEVTEGTLDGIWDRRRLRLALSELLTNALKFGEEREVVVAVARTADGVRVEVRDRGQGVPVGERRRIFGAYVTGSNAPNAGLGLGLYVSYEIVRRHGGRMGVRARPDGGSIFW
ncbi:MAG TPA: HAMP domain-containing sensor histidine kinase, partial [Ktedonobacterales bacterium]|nr:HAMP domain-containing sensor histidine kinase [Ktedonobacterales bacterium]